MYSETYANKVRKVIACEVSVESKIKQTTSI